MEDIQRQRKALVLLVSILLVLCGCANQNRQESDEDTRPQTTLAQPEKTQTTAAGAQAARTTLPEKTQTTSSRAPPTTLQEKYRPEALTLRQAWNRLFSSADAPDLKFLAYSASGLDSEGKTRDYNITGYSRSEDRAHYITSSASLGRQYRSVRKPGGITATYDISQVKDSQQMVREIAALKGGCSQGMKLEFSASRKTVQASCEPEWSSVDAYSYLK